MISRTQRRLFLLLSLSASLVTIFKSFHLLSKPKFDKEDSRKSAVINKYFEKNDLNKAAETTTPSIEYGYDITASNNTCDLKDIHLEGNISIIDPPPNLNAFTLDPSNIQIILTERHLDAKTTPLYQAILCLQSLEQGGSWKPQNCRARHRVALIIPYRNRLPNFNQFLLHMHPLLQRQRLEYTFFIVEQLGNGTWNKGILMNAGFIEVFKNKVTNQTFDCYFFHDVDMLPTNDRVLYSCPDKRPRHHSIKTNGIDYSRSWNILVGGVLVFLPQNFIQVNGYSNKFWGWGAEDDNMYFRLMNPNITLGFDRPKYISVNYQMLRHLPQKKSNIRNRYSFWTMRNIRGGLSDTKYVLKGFTKFLTHTHLYVDVGLPPIDMDRFWKGALSPEEIVKLADQ